MIAVLCSNRSVRKAELELEERLGWAFEQRRRTTATRAIDLLRTWPPGRPARLGVIRRGARVEVTPDIA